MRFALAVPVLLLSAPCMAQMVSSGVGGYGMGAQTNNPVSMVFEHKQTQTLTDGTHISLVSHEYFYRDNLGRTRIETEFVTPISWTEPTGSQRQRAGPRDPDLHHLAGRRHEWHDAYLYPKR